MAERLRVADVGLDVRSGGSEAVYTYRADESARPGQARFVPLGRRQVLGFVLGVREIDPSQLGFSVSQLKDLGEPIDGIDLPAATVELIQETARQTLSPLPVALSPATPPGVLERVAEVWEPLPLEGAVVLTAADQEALRVLAEEGRIVVTTAKPLPDTSKKRLRKLAEMGLARRFWQVQRPTERQASPQRLRLTLDSDKVEHFLRTRGAQQPAQAMTLMRLQGSQVATFTLDELKAFAGVGERTVKSLLSAGLLDELLDAPAAPVSPPTPNEEQQVAIDQIGAAIRARRHEEYLLYGVTGSGKTEVYLRCAAEALRLGRQVLYLVPEIALTAQVIAQLRERFGEGVAVLHSNMTPRDRLENWLRVRRGDAPVVLGARSALFAPLANLGLIVVDEEHETSYKQDTSPRYDARRLARFLAQRSGAALVLGSATPSAESYHHALEGRLRMLRLPRRARDAVLPSVEVIDLAALYRSGSAAVLSQPMVEGIAGALHRGEQAILFLNRRAYAPFLACRDCGYRFNCPQCSVTLAFHRSVGKLKCHHCGLEMPAATVCERCGGIRVAPFGIGVEKVEESVKNTFPNASVGRLDRDVAQKKGALEQVFAEFRSGTMDILVGTQMVAKGLDFPNVTFVGVIAADTGLAMPDFRAAERTFQLLSQVSGRAGRGNAPGTVVIQTLNPDHESITCAQNHDTEGFLAGTLAERRETTYPPFCRLMNVVISGESRRDVMDVSSDVAARLRRALPTARVLGPADCALERIGGHWRRHVLVKMEPGADYGSVGDAMRGVERKEVRVVLDIDPSSLI